MYNDTFQSLLRIDHMQVVFLFFQFHCVPMKKALHRILIDTSHKQDPQRYKLTAIAPFPMKM